MAKNRRVIGLGVVIFIGLLITIFSATFIINEGRQVVITQFGKPVRSVNKPGLHFKLPFIQDVRRIDLRILSWDGFPNQIPTRDKKYIEVDTTARWKIVDPLKFIQTVQDERGARSRLDAILDGITRDIVSGHNLVEVVRNSNDIFDVIAGKRAKAKEEAAADQRAADKKANEEGDESSESTVTQRQIEEPEEITGEIEKVEIGREKLSQLIIERARTELKPLGIDLIDVLLKRISYEQNVEKKVYGRMISERQRIAEKIRSYGKGEQAKIQGKTQRDLQSIQSSSYRKVQAIKGKAEAQAIDIYAEALGKDPRFYRFMRSLEAYKKSMPKDSKLLLSSKSKFWKVLKDGD